MKRYNWKENRFYSISEDEGRLYSTGNEDLDDLLEKAFSDGYVYAQKEFVSVRAQKNAFNSVVRGVATNNPKLANSAANRFNFNAAKKANPNDFRGLQKYNKTASTKKDVAKVTGISQNKVQGHTEVLPEIKVQMAGKTTYSPVPGKPGLMKTSITPGSEKVIRPETTRFMPNMDPNSLSSNAQRILGGY